MKANRIALRRPGRQRGVNLIELMVVVLIIGMLTAIAVPGYRSHVVKTHRAAAKTCLTQYQQLLERYYTTNLSYVNAGDDLADPACAVEDDMPNFYTFELSGLSATEYVITAERTDNFAERETQCGDLTLNSRGQRGVSSGSVANCW